ncbi:hypothetical protein [Cupriavidus sp. D39]|uniref:hypothetical protein n=1 Tax=Cupriavidus sp. D39 TaxID=2997877 RepID=UPI00226DA224|nr:hypothetical protein [Cupriavidus sp. D39]MCY0854977.1 hypothetical protein [Cupriavidus sp. D39]
MTVPEEGSSCQDGPRTHIKDGGNAPNYCRHSNANEEPGESDDLQQERQQPDARPHGEIHTPPTVAYFVFPVFMVITASKDQFDVKQVSEDSCGCQGRMNDRDRAAGSVG